MTHSFPTRRSSDRVNVGGPHMERHGADLEAETREHEHDAENQPDVHLTAEHLDDAGEIGRPGEAVEQRNAIEQHARRERAENEIRSEEHTSELQSLMRNSYTVYCLKKKKQH